MLVLTMNAGSSSVKYSLFSMPEEERLAKGIVDRVGTGRAILRHESGGRKAERPVPEGTYEAAVGAILEALSEPEGPLRRLSEVRAVGHRVVHGGDEFSEPVVVDEKVEEAIERWADLAPLHNPPNLAALRACRRLLPEALHVAVFDTAFHVTIPERAWRYAIPRELADRLKIRRYGFHGTSHRFVTETVLRLMAQQGSDPSRLRLVVAHLGAGCSMSAVLGGRCLDTSMGFTPLEGLVMGTRSGDLDPAVVTFLQERLSLSPREVYELLNRKSGLLGLSGLSADARDIERAAEGGHPGARLALEVFAYRARKYIGAYAAALGGLDAVAFTAGIGERSPLLRAMILDGLEFLGIELDHERNERAVGVLAEISTSRSKAKVFVIPTDEELLIAREAARLAGI